jgi:hypothetical protein
MRLVAILCSMALLSIVQTGRVQAANCLHPVTFCDTSIPPNCTKRCFNTFVASPDGVSYSIRLQNVPADLASAVAGRAGVQTGQAFHSGSRLLLKGISKENVPLVLDRLNIDKSTVAIPK